MMIFGVGALTCATKCGRKRLQPIDRGHPTAVPAGTSPATSSAGDCARAFSGLTESRQIPFGLRSMILCANRLALGSIMGVAYSQDLRDRVMAAVDGGLGVYAAVPLFRVSVSYI